MSKLSTRNIILLTCLVILLVLAVLLAIRYQPWQGAAAPTPTPNLSNMQRYEDKGHGLALEMPPDWAVLSVADGITLASHERVFELPSFNEIGADGVMVIIPGELEALRQQLGDEYPGADAVALLRLYINTIMKDDEGYSWILPPAAISVNGQRGARTVMKSEAEDVTLEVVLAVIVNPETEQVAFVSTAARQENAAAYRPTFEAIINTLLVNPPSVGP